MKTILRTLYLFLFCAVVSRSSCQTTNTAAKFLWVEEGLLLGSAGPGMQTGISYAFGKNLICLQGYHAEELLVGFIEKTKVNTVQKIENLSLCYGYSFVGDHMRLTPSLGLSIGQGNWRNSHVDTSVSGNSWLFKTYTYNYHYDKFRYAGVHAGIDFNWALTKCLGIGLNFFRNFHIHSDSGFAITLLAGRLR